MANVHRIGDLNNNRSGGGRGGRPPIGGGMGSLPFLRQGGGGGDPRKESFFDMLKLTCCPSLNIKMFTAIITIIDVTIFILVIGLGGLQPESQFLTPSYDALHKFGGRNTCDIKHGQVWRLITPVFLHANFLHLFFNTISTLILGCITEVMVGTKNLIVLYFVSAFGGNIFGVLVSDDPSVGASTAISGLLGAYLAYIIVNWETMNYEGSPRNMMLCFVIVIIMFNLMFGTASSAQGSSQSYIDNYGHLGGLIAGTFAGMALIDAINNRYAEWEQKIRKIGYIGASLFLGGCTLSFFLFRTPNCQ